MPSSAEVPDCSSSGVLRSETTNRRRAVAAYYQGLGAVRSHGLYGETHAYVANVLALKRRLEAGLPLT